MAIQGTTHVRDISDIPRLWSALIPIFALLGLAQAAEARAVDGEQIALPSTRDGSAHRGHHTFAADDIPEKATENVHRESPYGTRRAGIDVAATRLTSAFLVALGDSSSEHALTLHRRPLERFHGNVRVDDQRDAEGAPLSVAQRSTTQIAEVDSGLNEMIGEAVRAYHEERYAEAADLLELIVEQVPYDANLVKLLVNSAYWAGDADRTIEAGEHFLSFASDNEVRLKTADMYQSKGNIVRASELYEEMLRFPDEGLIDEAKGRFLRLATVEYGGNFRDRTFFLYERPVEGLRGYFRADYRYNDNIAASVDPGSTPPEDTAASGFTYDLNLRYDKWLSERYYAGAWTRPYAVFWTGSADDLDWQRIENDLHFGAVGDRWNLVLAYRNIIDYFDFELTRVRHGAEARINYWLFPNTWHASIAGGVAHDDFKAVREANATVYQGIIANTVYDYLDAVGAYSYYYFGYAYTRNQAKSIFSYDGHLGAAEWYLPTPFWNTAVKLGGVFEHRRYDEPNPINRRDNIARAYLILIKFWELPDWLRSIRRGGRFSTELSFEYEKTSSTVDLFDKDERFVSVAARYDF